MFANPDSLCGRGDPIERYQGASGIRAIMSGDMAGYTRAMRENERRRSLTVAHALAEVIEPAIQSTAAPC